MQITPNVPFPPVASRARLEQMRVVEERAMDQIQQGTAALASELREAERRTQRDLQLQQSAHRARSAGEVLQTGVAAAIGLVGMQLGLPALVAVPIVAAFAACTLRSTLERRDNLEGQRVTARLEAWNHRQILQQQRGLERETAARLQSLRDAIAKAPPDSQQPNFLELAASI